MIPSWRRRVRQPQAADDVADRVDVRLLRAHVAVDLDDPAVRLDLRGLEADVLDVGGAAGRDQQELGARSRSASLPSGPTIRLTPVFEALTPATSKRALVMTVMPRFVKLRSSALLTSASSSGTICGRYSSSVTLTPTSWNMLANSTPTAPAPTMMMSLGSESILRTSSLVTIRLPSGVEARAAT